MSDLIGALKLIALAGAAPYIGDEKVLELARGIDRTARSYDSEPGKLAYQFAAQRDAIAEAVLKAQDEAVRS